MRCSKCGRFRDTFTGRMVHKCPPAWRVWCPVERGENEADAKTIFAFDAEAAAEEWAEQDDRYSAEYGIVGGSSVVVHVQAVDSDEVTRWSVSGESVPSYSASEL